MSKHTDTEQNLDDQQLNQLAVDLSDENGMKRRHAREALERAGKAVAPLLMEKLRSPDVNVRWEAAKALIKIADPSAGPSLVQSLMDECFEVQWLAAEGLIALGPDALKPLLEGLVHNFSSTYMRQGAHHVLHDLEQKGMLPPKSALVLDELRYLEPLEPYPITARRALKELSGQSEATRQAVNE